MAIVRSKTQSREQTRLFTILVVVVGALTTYWRLLLQVDKGDLQQHLVQARAEVSTSTDHRPPNYLVWKPNVSNAAATRPTEEKPKYYSQKGQDQWVLEQALPKATGPGLFYVDLAANHPTSLSNTKTLDDLGWSGLCIDGNENLIPPLRNERSCTVVQGITDLCEGKNVAWQNLGGTRRKGSHTAGGIVGEEFDNKVVVEGRPTEVRQTTTLGRVLDDIGAPKVIDYLSLDVEGAEWRVLKSFPFEKYIFKTMTIERPTPWVNQLLKERGYVWVKNYKFDSFYVHETHPMAPKYKDQKLEQILGKCNGRSGTNCPWGPQPPDEQC